MGFKTADLWRKPDLNPVNRKAKSVPVLNPIDPHGRVFFFSWLGFMLAFWAWYAFPPLVCSATLSNPVRSGSLAVIELR